MKNIHLTFIFILLLSFMCSCEGYRCATGTICDAATHQPIDSVKCEVLLGSDIEFSDSIGNFSICNERRGCVWGCPDIEVTFSKVGYKIQKTTNPSQNVLIFMEKE